MHYAHRLTSGQKSAAIALFVMVPLAFLTLLFYLWADNQRLFTETFYLKSNFKSAQGMDRTTSVSLSGIQIGRVFDVKLNDAGVIEVTLRIDSAYKHMITTGSIAELSALSIIGQKEVKIRPGKKGMPGVKDGDFIESEEPMELENIMDRVTPLIRKAESMFFKFEEILSSFPGDSLNAAVTDTSEIIANIKTGKSSVGQIVSADGGKLYRKIDTILARVNTISIRVEEVANRMPEMADKAATVINRMPEMADKATTVLSNAVVISEKAKEATRDFADLPEMQRSFAKVLDNIDRVLDDVSAITPALKKATGNIAEATDRVPILMDDIETALSESLLLIESIKASWPVKNLVPEVDRKPVIDTSQMESPYTPDAGQ